MQKSNILELFPIKDNKKWGYINQVGEVVIEPQFSDALPFHENLAAVKIQRKYGFINTSAEMVIDPQFDSAHSFHEGYAKVLKKKRNSYSNWGFIDIKGAYAVKSQFEAVNSFSNGLALVKNESGLSGFIDPTGAFIIPARFKGSIDNFSEGLAAVRDISGFVGYIDLKGEWAIKPQFEKAGPFSEGLAEVSVKGKVYFIDKNNTVIIDTGFDATSFLPNKFSEGLVKIYDSSGPERKKGGYMDTKGNIVIAPAFDWYEDFSEGFAMAGPCSTQQGLIDRQGKYVLPPLYYSVYGFSKGLCKIVPDVSRPETFGYIAKNFQFIWQPTKRFARKFWVNQ